MKVLLSIKPRFAELIFEGVKRFEFRKAIFKNPHVKTVVVYASSPVQKVIGEFSFDEILEYDPSTLWKKTKNHSGITEHYFDEYFANRATGYAIKITDVKEYEEPLCLKGDFNIQYPPQSFMYLKD